MKRTILLAGLVLALGLGTHTRADVALTTAEQIRSEVGGTATIAYDRIRTLSITVDAVNDTMRMSFELYASSDAAAPAYRGSYDVDAASNTAKVKIERIGFEGGITISAGQATSVTNSIASIVADVESSMAQFGLANGTQQ